MNKIILLNRGDACPFQESVWTFKRFEGHPITILIDQRKIPIPIPDLISNCNLEIYQIQGHYTRSVPFITYLRNLVITFFSFLLNWKLKPLIQQFHRLEETYTLATSVPYPRVPKSVLETPVFREGFALKSHLYKKGVVNFYLITLPEGLELHLVPVISITKESSKEEYYLYTQRLRAEFNPNGFIPTFLEIFEALLSSHFFNYKGFLLEDFLSAAKQSNLGILELWIKLMTEWIKGSKEISCKGEKFDIKKNRDHLNEREFKEILKGAQKVGKDLELIPNATVATEVFLQHAFGESPELPLGLIKMHPGLIRLIRERDSSLIPRFLLKMEPHFNTLVTNLNEQHIEMTASEQMILSLIKESPPYQKSQKIFSRLDLLSQISILKAATHLPKFPKSVWIKSEFKKIHGPKVLQSLERFNKGVIKIKCSEARMKSLSIFMRTFFSSLMEDAFSLKVTFPEGKKTVTESGNASTTYFNLALKHFIEEWLTSQQLTQFIRMIPLKIGLPQENPNIVLNKNRKLQDIPVSLENLSLTPYPFLIMKGMRQNSLEALAKLTGMLEQTCPDHQFFMAVSNDRDLIYISPFFPEPLKWSEDNLNTSHWKPLPLLNDLSMFSKQGCHPLTPTFRTKLEGTIPEELALLSSMSTCLGTESVLDPI